MINDIFSNIFNCKNKKINNWKKLYLGSKLFFNSYPKKKSFKKKSKLSKFKKTYERKIKMPNKDKKAMNFKKDFLCIKKHQNRSVIDKKIEVEGLLMKHINNPEDINKMAL